jgi:CysZ protein
VEQDIISRRRCRPSFDTDPPFLAASKTRVIVMVSAAYLAFVQILSPPFRAILWKSLLLTLVLLLLVGISLTKLLDWWLSGTGAGANYPGLEAYAVLLAGAGLFVGLGYLLPAISMLVAGFFLDDVAEKVERQSYPQDRPGEALPLGLSILSSARFALTMLLVNLIALLFLFIPGLNLVAFFVANAYLLGQEYFSLAAGRHLPPDEVRALKSRHCGTLLLGGALLGVLVAIPVANLLTPLFGTAFMVHLYKRIDRRTPTVPARV